LQATLLSLLLGRLKLFRLFGTACGAGIFFLNNVYLADEFWGDSATNFPLFVLSINADYSLFGLLLWYTAATVKIPEGASNDNKKKRK
jgi:hypothetical protein